MTNLATKRWARPTREKKQKASGHTELVKTRGEVWRNENTELVNAWNSQRLHEGDKVGEREYWQHPNKLSTKGILRTAWLQVGAKRGTGDREGIDGAIVVIVKAF